MASLVESASANIGSVDQYFYGPFLDIDNVQTYLAERTSPGKSSATSLGDKIVIFKEGEFSFYLNDLNPETLKSTINVEEQFQSALKRAEIHQINRHLTSFEFDITEKVFSFMPPEGMILPTEGLRVVNLSERDPTYYDLGLELFQNNGWQHIDYIHRSRENCSHSGDKNTGTNLCQYISVSKNVNAQAGILVSSYQNSKLWEYCDKQPFILVVSLTGNFIIPVPLDKHSIGNATMCLPAVMVFQGEQVFIKPLSVIIKSDDSQIEQGATEEMKNVIMEAEFEDIFLKNAEIITPTLTLAEKSSGESAEEPGDKTMDIIEGLTIIRCIGIKQPNDILTIKSQKEVVFGTRAVFCLDGKPDTRIHKLLSLEEVNFGDITIGLPVLSGEFNGPPSTLMCSPIPKLQAKVSSEGINQRYFSSGFPIIYLNEECQEKMSTGYLRFEGVIVHVIENPPIFIGGIVPQEFLNKIVQTGLNYWAAPLSILMVAIKISGVYNFYYLGGIRNNSLIPEKCSFGQFLGNSELISQKIHLLMDENIFSGKNPVNINSMSSIHFGDSQLAISEFIDLFERSSFEFLEENLSKITNGIVQITRMFNTNELREIMDTFLQVLQKNVLEIRNEVSVPIEDINEFMSLQEEHIIQFRKLKGEQTRRKRILKILIELVSSSKVSTKDIHTKGMSLKQHQKAQKISANLDAVREIKEDLTGNSFEEFIEEYYSQVGSVIYNLQGLDEFYKQIWNKSFIEGGGLMRLLESSAISVPCPRTFNLDALTTSTLSTLSKSNEQYNRHRLADNSGLSLMIPDSDRSESCVMLLIPDDVVNLEDPFKSSWPNMADKPSFAYFRMMLAGSLSNNLTTRDRPLSPASLEIRWLTASIIMNSMTNLTKPSSDGSIDFDSNICKIMRGLMCQYLTTIAAGQNPLCYIWQLISNSRPTELPKKNHEWLILKNMCYLWKYTGWSDEQLKNQLIKFIIRIINRTVQVATIPLQEQKKQDKKDSKNDMDRIFYKNFVFFQAYRKALYYLLSKQDSHFIEEIQRRFMWTPTGNETDTTKFSITSEQEKMQVIEIMRTHPRIGKFLKSALENPQFENSQTTREIIEASFLKRFNPFLSLSRILYELNQDTQNKGIPQEIFTEKILPRFKYLKETFGESKQSQHLDNLFEKVNSGDFITLEFDNLYSHGPLNPKVVSVMELEDYNKSLERHQLEQLNPEGTYFKGWRPFTIPPGINSVSLSLDKDISQAAEEPERGLSPLEEIIEKMVIKPTSESRKLKSFISDPDSMSLIPILEIQCVPVSDFQDIFKFIFPGSKNSFMIKIMFEVVEYCVLNWDTENTVIEENMVERFKSF